MSELVNEIIFVYVFSLFMGMAAGVYIGVSSGPVLAGIAATIYLIPTFLKLRDVEGFSASCLAGITLPDSKDDGIPSGAWKKPSAEEGFASFKTTFSGVDSAKNAKPNEGILPFQDETAECVKNPFHNVLVDQIKYNPTRGPAPDITTTQRKIDLDEFFRVQWYSDPTDVFGKNQSQREFVSAPVTTIPNDQKSYQEWLYKIPGKTCKEGGAENCYGGTDGAALPWLNL